MEQAMSNVAEAEALGAPVEAPTVCEAFQRLVAQQPHRVALRTLDDRERLTWSQLDERVRAVAGGLSRLGVGKADTVAMLLPNSVVCHLVDLAAVHLGAVPFTIYNSSSAEQVAYQLRNADATVLVCERSFLPRVEEARRDLPALAHVIVTDGDGGTTTLAEVEAAGADVDVEAAWRAVGPEDLVTMIYTSGTTGPPKGAQWAHRTVMSQLRSLGAVVPLAQDDVISFLPMAHAGGRITSHYMALVHGATITVCPDMRELPTYLAQVHPDTLFSVPRLWEKFQVAIEGMVQALPDDQREAAQRAIAEGLEEARAQEAGGVVREDGVARTSRAERLTVLRPVLARLGLDRIRSAFVGGAPSAPELSQFFRAVGVPLLEAYGLTEGSLNVFNRIEEFKGGTAGLPLPDVELRLAADGEILVRSPLNFVGYRNDPEKTAETLDTDGWLHTGDIGRLDEDGYLTVVDRKKEIIISAAGKNMSPANIEQAIKAESSLIGQVVCIGDGRRYNTALITLDPEAAQVHGARLGLEAGAFEELVGHPEVRAEVERAVGRGNARLSTVESVRKFTLLADVWLPDTEVLTPTAKLKRRAVDARYAEQIEAMYAE
ncbi:long-chain fatty acid--CoA ligase [Conexibacter sp. SYSU D00693]|uniref:AMP-dependent synthetase/ligase n=1 Tax=Conexibacter sp. SYSU D00693 TaxID=2812560 RepID=UPI00196ACE7E|nr:AMP-dependent synthetase/ligase [Conexibacter sp. SYSU D00693]